MPEKNLTSLKPLSVDNDIKEQLKQIHKQIKQVRLESKQYVEDDLLKSKSYWEAQLDFLKKYELYKKEAREREYTEDVRIQDKLLEFRKSNDEKALRSETTALERLYKQKKI